MTWYTAHWDDWNKDDLYDCLALRTAVFVIEQNCPYQEVDGKDRSSWHLWARDEGQVVAYARIVAPGVSYPEVSIGRVVVADSIRGKGLGRKLMVRSLAFIRESLGPQPVRISAQEYLLDFYRTLGFETVGTGYLEDGIPHQQMLILSP